MSASSKLSDPNFSDLQGHILLVCPECGREFAVHTAWRSHLDQKHSYKKKTPKDLNFYIYDKEHYMCHTCDQLILKNKPMSSLLLHLQYHYFMHATYPNIYKCLRCMKDFERKRLLCEHLCTVHPITTHLIRGMQDFAARLKSGQDVKESDGNASESPESPMLTATYRAKTVPQVKNAKSSGPSKTKANARYKKQSDPLAFEEPSTSTVLNKEATDAKNTSVIRHPEFYIQFVCPQCGIPLPRFKNWKEHIEIAHRNTVQVLNLNMQKKPDTGDFFCCICRRTLLTRNRQSLIRHYFEHLPYKFQYQCAFCSQRSKYKSELLIHAIKSHSDVYLENRERIQAPIEFGVSLNAKLKNELQSLLKRKLPQGIDHSPTDKPKSLTAPQEKQVKHINLKKQPRMSPVSLEDPRKKPLDVKKPDMLEKALKASFMDFPESSPKNSRNNAKATSLVSNTKTQEVTSDASAFKKPLPVIKSKTPRSVSKTDNLKYDSQKTLATASVLRTKAEPASIKLLRNDRSRSAISVARGNIKKDSSLGCGGDEAKPSSSKCTRTEFSESDASTTSSSSNDCDFSKEQLREFFRFYVDYQCMECGQDVDDYLHLQKHMRAQHNPEQLLNAAFQLRNDGKSYLCLKCKEVMKTKSNKELFLHRAKHFAHKAFLRCKLCGDGKSKENKMYVHLQSKHDILFEIQGSPPDVSSGRLAAQSHEGIGPDVSFSYDDGKSSNCVKDESDDMDEIDIDIYECLQHGVQPFELSEEKFRKSMLYYAKARLRYEYLCNNVDNDDFFV